MWSACHRCSSLAALREERADHLDPDEDGEERERRPDGQGDDRERDPEHLRDRDRPDVGNRRRASHGIVASRSRPEKDHGNAHHDVTGDHHPVVDGATLVDRRKHLLEPEREDDHADHLHHRREPHHPVVGVIGGREPRVVDPRPGDRERGNREPKNRRPDVALREVTGELVRCRPEGDDERQVVEKLERRRAAVLLVRITPRKTLAAMRSNAHRTLRHAEMLPSPPLGQEACRLPDGFAEALCVRANCGCDAATFPTSPGGGNQHRSAAVGEAMTQRVGPDELAQRQRDRAGLVDRNVRHRSAARRRL
jgi:hypothetical protein